MQTNSFEDLSALLEDHRRESGLPALVAAVVSDTKLLATGASGLRSVESTNRVTVDDVFHMGSCTKSMTALLALLMAEQGKVRLESRPPELLPDWEFASGYEAISLEELLQNRSGMGNKRPDELWATAFRASGNPTAQRERFLREIVKLPLEAKPGTTYIYSNHGFALAGLMLEKAAGKPWEEMVRQEILEPLGMRSAGFGPPGSDGALDAPRGHQWRDGKAELAQRIDNPAAIAPAGAVHASVMDVARYAAFHLAAARKKVAPLSRWTSKLYTPPEGSDYALGWIAVDRSWAGGKALTHAGSNTMFYCLIWLAPARNLGFVVMTNVAGREGNRSGEACDRVVGELIRRFAR